MNAENAWSHETSDGVVNCQIEVDNGVIELTRLGPKQNQFKQITTNIDCLTDSYQYFGSDECFKAKLWTGNDGTTRLYARFQRTDDRRKYWEHFVEGDAE